jgi:hypothetical protein
MAFLTNLHGLPDALVAAVKNDPYSGGGDISVTKLIDAPQKRYLAKKYRDSVVEDVSERIWALMGQAVHTVLERANTSALVEKRLFAEVAGWKLSGQFDRLHLSDETLQDWKVCSVYKANGDDGWTRQLNVLRWLAKNNGISVGNLQVVAIFRDWKMAESLRNSDYPKQPIRVIDVPVWSDEEIFSYINERINLHQRADAGESIECTEEDRWYSGTSFALIKTGGKRATKVSLVKEDLGDPPKGYEIQERKGSNRRCENYCEVAPFCPQFQNIKEQQGASDDVSL